MVDAKKLNVEAIVKKTGDTEDDFVEIKELGKKVLLEKIRILQEQKAKLLDEIKELEKKLERKADELESEVSTLKKDAMTLREILGSID